VLVSVTAAVLLLGAAPARAERDWFVSLYGGQFAGSRDGDLIELRFRDSYVIGLSLAKEFEQVPPHMRWELETHLLQHVGAQDHLELAFSINVRWVTFPWDAYLDTSVGFGSGLSYATEVPEAESQDNPETGATRLLHYLLVDVAVALPGETRWSLFTRMHHRSGMWGFFDGVGRASNFLGGGIRYRF
jgi:hypothetical protein